MGVIEIAPLIAVGLLGAVGGVCLALRYPPRAAGPRGGRTAFIPRTPRPGPEVPQALPAAPPQDGGGVLGALLFALLLAGLAGRQRDDGPGHP